MEKRAKFLLGISASIAVLVIGALAYKKRDEWFGDDANAAAIAANPLLNNANKANADTEEAETQDQSNQIDADSQAPDDSTDTTVDEPLDNSVSPDVLPDDDSVDDDTNGGGDDSGGGGGGGGGSQSPQPQSPLPYIPFLNPTPVHTPVTPPAPVVSHLSTSEQNIIKNGISIASTKVKALPSNTIPSSLLSSSSGVLGPSAKSNINNSNAPAKSIGSSLTSALNSGFQKSSSSGSTGHASAFGKSSTHVASFSKKSAKSVRRK